MSAPYTRALAGKIKNTLGHGIATLKRFFAESRAVSTVEYALIVVAVIAIVGVGAATLGGAFKGLFQDLESKMQAASTATTTKAAGSTTGGTTTGGTTTGGTTTGGTTTGTTTG